MKSDLVAITVESSSELFGFPETSRLDVDVVRDIRHVFRDRTRNPTGRFARASCGCCMTRNSEGIFSQQTLLNTCSLLSLHSSVCLSVAEIQKTPYSKIHSFTN